MESMFKSLVGNIPAAVYRCANDTHWTVSYITEYMEKLSGYPASDFIGNRVRSLESVIHPKDRKLVDDVVNAALKERNEYTVRYRVTHADGSIRWVMDSGCGVFDSSGELAFLDGALFDETDKHAQEERIGRQYALLDDIATFGLPKLNGYINSLRDAHRKSASQQSPVSHSEKSTEQNVQLLQNLMDNIVSLSLSGRSADPSPVDLNAVLWEVQRDLQTAISQCGARIKVGELPKVVLNPSQARRLFAQLIDNAIKFNTSGTVAISVEATVKADIAVICVSDNGIGFDVYFIDSAFEPGSRSQNAIGFPGDGFGLAVCKAILDAVGQDIWITSDTRSGSSVYFTLPIAEH